MFIYKKYILKNTFEVFSIVSIIVVFVLLVVQMIKFISLLDRGLPSLQFIELLYCTIPILLFRILPLILFLSIVYVYTKLSKNLELIAFSSASINSCCLAMPTLLLTLIVTVIHYTLSLYLLPLCTSKIKSTLKQFRQNDLVMNIKPNTINAITSRCLIYVEKRSPNNLLQGIVLIDQSDKERTSVMLASNGQFVQDYNSDIILNLHNVKQYLIKKEENATVITFANLFLNLSSFVKVNKPSRKAMQEYYFNELIENIRNNAFLPKIIVRFKAELTQRLLWPFYNLVLSVISLSILLTKLGLHNSKNKLLLSNALMILVCWGHFTCYNIATKYAFGNLLACMNIIFGITVGFLIAKVVYR